MYPRLALQLWLFTAITVRPDLLPLPTWITLPVKISGVISCCAPRALYRILCYFFSIVCCVLRHWSFSYRSLCAAFLGQVSFLIFVIERRWLLSADARGAKRELSF